MAQPNEDNDFPMMSPLRKTGAEHLTTAGSPLDATVSDFWGWSRSDLIDNLTRGVLAEFIVAKALCISTDKVRESWAPWDLTTPDDVRVEVKSASYIQSWSQMMVSKIAFGTPKTLAFDPRTAKFEAKAIRQADVYVFALLNHDVQATVNPLEMDQWQFYVVPTSELDDRRRSQHSITLASIHGELKKVPLKFGELRSAVQDAAAIERASSGVDSRARRSMSPNVVWELDDGAA
jgi:hypothetical protein